MKLIPLVFTTAALSAGALSACHHQSTTYAASPRDTAYVASHTVVTTTTTSGGDVAMAPDTVSTSTTVVATQVSSVDSTRSTRSNMRAERREVYDAMRSLRHAKYELEHAPHDFGGRRADAIKAVDAALRELRLASGQEAVERRSADGTPREERAAAADRQDLRNAIASLERARNDIEHAPHDYNGRKTAALQSVDRALQELRLAAEHEK